VESHVAVTSTVVAFFNDVLHVDVAPSDISTAHRMKAGPKDATRPVIIRFSSRRVRDAVFRAKKCLKNQTKPIYISEHLTKANSDLFFGSRKLLKKKKIYSTWTQNGLVYVKSSADASSRPVLVKCHADLNSLSILR
jgi:hypothetical protein